jgi:hypothetical protein
MTITWGKTKREITDDSCFVREAIREAADASGINPETAKFSDFPAHTQSAILRRAQEFKSEYHVNTEVIR